MGTVYLAEQEHPRRTVALKVIRPGRAEPELLKRFEQESAALGRLQHPAIAQIFEAGTADTGSGPQPFMAMEYISGRLLGQYVTSSHLDTRQTLELMIKICDGVQHAHQRGLIHRDLKPGNILVDDSGQPKILDFGVARVTEADTQATLQTGWGELVGTLAYMSPEQVLADPLELDTRSDVYSLGLILYELLAGRPPYQVSRKLDEAVRTIREVEPTRLSVINRQFRGDIETIVTKSLEKEKERRYASAASLAGDLRRYLQDEPIAARPTSASYQLRKFAQRHKPLVGGVAAVFVVLVLGIVASSWQALRALRAEQAAIVERDRAAAAERTSAAINEFLRRDLLSQAGASAQARPDNKPDPDLKVRTALDRAAASIGGRFDKEPLVEASIRETIGNTYLDLGLYPEGERQVVQAVELRRRALGDDHLDTVTGMRNLAVLYSTQGNNAAAEPLFAKVLEVRRRLLGAEHRDTLQALSNLGTVFQRQGKFREAESLAAEALEIQRRVLGNEHTSTLLSMNNLATIFLNQGKYASAEALLVEALDGRRRVLGADHPNTLTTMTNLAGVYRLQGKFDQAEPLATAAVEAARRSRGEQHPDTLDTINNLATIYIGQRKYAAAVALLDGALTSFEKTNADRWERFYARTLLGASLGGMKNYSEGERLLLSGYEGLLARSATMSSFNRTNIERAEDLIVNFYRDWGKLDVEAAWRRKLQAKQTAAKPDPRP